MILNFYYYFFIVTIFIISLECTPIRNFPNRTEEDTSLLLKNETKLSPSKLEKEAIEIDKAIQNMIYHHKVTLFSKTYCRFSKRAKLVLSKYDLKDYEIIELDMIKNGDKYLDGLKKFSGITTVPQLFVNGEFIGDSNKIVAKHESGTLMEILEDAKVIFRKRKHRA